MSKKLYDFSVEKSFTQTYVKYRDAHRAVREIRCMEQMYPDIFCGIQPGDSLAGRIRMSLIGFSPEPGGLGYYCDRDAIREILAHNPYSDDTRMEIGEMLSFWEKENTSARVRAAYPEALAKALPSDNWSGEPLPAAPLYRMAGSYLDYEKLLELGIPGLRQQIAGKKETANADSTVLYEAMDDALTLLAKCCLHYRAEALSQMENVSAHDEKQNLREMADALERITHSKPETLREAIQLMWLYILISGTNNYGRVDDLLGDFLVRDLESGRLTMVDAQGLFNDFWKLIDARKTTWNGRVVLGGRGRKNENAADLVALLGMEASRVVKEAEPQLTLRIYEGMNPKLLDKALEVIGEGRTYPMLYNDDVNIPAVAKAFNIGLEEAQNYVPFGCGEYVIDHKSFGSPNGIINLLKVLEITLRNGRDGVTGQLVGPETGRFEDFETFEDLWAAYQKQAEYFVDALARQEEIEYRVAGEAAPFLYLSILYDECIERGKGIFSGGIRYLGGTIETYGNINTADSLTAIKEIVYDKKLMTPAKLLQVLDADFEGFDSERLLLAEVPKYGNDDSLADSMAVRVHEHICDAVRDQIRNVDLHSYLVVIINNSANTTLGQFTAASADGRGRGIHMANANNPWGGNDRKGLTAMLNSLVKLRPDIHAGSVQNMKFSPELFKNDGRIVKSLLKTYFESGGTQAMISVVNRDDLEQAMIYPERYKNLFVRVGGFSARFVELERTVQLEILSRTLY